MFNDTCGTIHHMWNAAWCAVVITVTVRHPETIVHQTPCHAFDLLMAESHVCARMHTRQ
jgi:hypothetical protein